ncbi:target SNARE coiled-coil region [Nosema bombycis CQ1]|uniref:Target SNARE coiled-coil region n=1 Tax=Nosema bombycis (strain CQ1 / CVCC 102059) TaxID=578461 RepID=R0M244_NOSB1|nr:target SNARE coiled-coil region [Nosema bombycis CQ1]|eukprot:EOB12104.1 target SNARE coiled-coil region [Nosema bombycis CQ1]
MEEELKLAKSSKNIKYAAIELSEKVKQQDLLIEAIDSEIDKNSRALLSSMGKFERVLSILNNDPRNKIIACLLITAFVLLYFLFS